MKIKSILFVLAILISNIAGAQKFLEPSFTFSHDKTSFITLDDGSVVEGEIADLDRKKGLIEEVKIKDASGKKYTLKPAQIRHMYLPPSGWDKFASSMDFMTDVTKWEDTDLDKDIISKGYVYFEQAEVIVGKKKQTLLVQLLNPSFSSKIKVYHDPLATETTSLSVGGMNVAGGDAKSYYVSINKATAFKLKKADYKIQLKNLFGDCPDYMNQLGKSPSWSNLEKQVFNYAKSCQ